MERTDPALKRRPMSLRRRLTLLYAAGAVGVALVVALATVSFIHLTDTRRTLLSQIDPASLQADRLFQAYLDEETGIRGYILSRNTAFLEPYLSGAQAQNAASPILMRTLAGHPALRNLVRQAQQAADAWGRDFALPAVESTRAGDPLQVQQDLLGPGKTRFNKVRLRFAVLDAALAAERNAAGQALTTATRELIGTLVLGLALLLGAGVFLARALRKWITEPLATLGGSVRTVAAGDLARSIRPEGPPEIVQLSGDVEAMRLRIVNELEEVGTARADLATRNLELLRSNEELEQFAYVASHDLQEPLRKVTSFVQLLQQRYEHQLDDRADEYIGFAVDGAMRMQVLIDDLLAFSRVGRTTDSFVPVDLGACVRRATANLALLIDEADADVAIGPLPTVSGDPELLTSLWQNLIGNAVKFRSDARPVITVDATRQGGDWRCSVTDTGIGIEARFAERVFVIFQRLHSRDAYEGTGIGLALCRKIVEFHGGQIWVDQDYRPGARLCFTIPATTARGTA